MDQVRSHFDRFAVATLLNIISFILICISLFSEDWITASYLGISATAGICCNMGHLIGYFKVTLGFMFTMFFISIACVAVCCTVNFLKYKKPDEARIQLLTKIAGLLSAIIAIIALFLLFFTGISFATYSNYKVFRKLGGHYYLSMCYWLLIPITVLDAVAVYLSVDVRRAFNY